MTPNSQSAETFNQKRSQRISLISQARSGTKSERRLATQSLMAKGLLMRLHNGSGIDWQVKQRRLTPSAVCEGLALACTALGLAILWHTGVLGA